LLDSYFYNTDEIQIVRLHPYFKTFNCCFLNHSHNPNVHLFKRDDDSCGCMTLRDIKEGEELFEDYNMLDILFDKFNLKGIFIIE